MIIYSDIVNSKTPCAHVIQELLICLEHAKADRVTHSKDSA